MASEEKCEAKVCVCCDRAPADRRFAGWADLDGLPFASSCLARGGTEGLIDRVRARRAAAQAEVICTDERGHRLAVGDPMNCCRITGYTVLELLPGNVIRYRTSSGQENTGSASVFSRAQAASPPAQEPVAKGYGGCELRVGDPVWHMITKHAGTVAGLNDVGGGNIPIDWGGSEVRGALPCNLRKLPAKTTGGSSDAAEYPNKAGGAPDVADALNVATDQPPVDYRSQYAIPASKTEPEFSGVAAYAVVSRPKIDPKARPEWPYKMAARAKGGR